MNGLSFNLEYVEHQTKSYDNLETYDPIFERRKIGLYILFNWMHVLWMFEVFKAAFLPSNRKKLILDKQTYVIISTNFWINNINRQNL